MLLALVLRHRVKSIRDVRFGSGVHLNRSSLRVLRVFDEAIQRIHQVGSPVMRPDDLGVLRLCQIINRLGDLLIPGGRIDLLVVPVYGLAGYFLPGSRSEGLAVGVLRKLEDLLFSGLCLCSGLLFRSLPLFFLFLCLLLGEFFLLLLVLEGLLF